MLRSLINNRKYKYTHGDRRKMSNGQIPVEFESCDKDLNNEKVETETVERDCNKIVEQERNKRKRQ